MDADKTIKKPMCKILSKVFIVFCLLGFCFQSGHVSYQYFLYQTTTKVDISHTQPVFNPTLVVCPRYIDVLNGDHRESCSINDLQCLYQSLSRLTLWQILESTPATTDVISSCWYRDPTHQFIVREGNATNCNSLFTILKMYIQQYICYPIVPLNKNSNLKDVVHSILNPMSFYTLVLTEKISSSKEILIYTLNGKYGFVSRSFGHILTRPNGKPTGVSLKITTYNLTYLPPPYDTRCSNERDAHNTVCIRKCIQDAFLSKVGRFPFTEFVKSTTGTGREKNIDVNMANLSVKHHNPIDFDNETMNRAYEESKEKCLSKCHGVVCIDDYLTTSMTTFDSGDSNNKLTVRVMSPNSPMLVISTHALLDFYEFVIYLCSCIGIWFGLSALSGNPFSWWERRKLQCQPVNITLPRRRHIIHPCCQEWVKKEVDRQIAEWKEKTAK